MAREQERPKAERVTGKDVMSTSYQNWERRLDGGMSADDFTRYIEDRERAAPGEKDKDRGLEDDDR